MILIVSSTGHTVNKVMDWLTYYGRPYIRFSDIDHFFGLIHIELGNNDLSIRIKNDKFDIDLCDIKVVWAWHGNIRFKDLSLKEVYQVSANRDVTNNLWSQIQAIYGFIEDYLASKSAIGHLSLQNINKLAVLRAARDEGLDIPHTFISSYLSSLREFAAGRKMITKSIQETVFVQDLGAQLILEGYTAEIKETDFKAVNKEYVFPSLVQEKLDKKYELRIFYLKEKCYSMAIFSQRDKQTEIDFRRYNNENPNRMMSCSIPHELERKIVTLMNKLNLNSGSLDFVKTKDGRYVFLEVNPVGQFGFVSDSCNYDLEKAIAEELISYC